MRTEKTLHLCCYTVGGEDLKNGGTFEDTIVIDMDSVRKSRIKSITEYIAKIYDQDKERQLKVLSTQPDESLITNLDLFNFFLYCKNPQQSEKGVPISGLPKLENIESDPPHTEIVEGYTITDRVRIKNVEIVLGENTDKNDFAVWRKGVNSRVHYRKNCFSDRLSALENLHLRALDEIGDFKFLEQKKAQVKSGGSKKPPENRGAR
ncbi:MAG: hypothetical protein FWE04_01000 [Oscillospiraceae bacterium]|nr:hypothetical protein [Oscillospiraceae bacterium]